uniref:Uncharacterized protein n=1 Tax=Pseudomonas syringae pv. actinidiae TaxID=103796 RepID=A0A2P0QFR7_PSESF|nr:hypothetical protein [Pseudomonas syringae pv. actinidiae]
MIYQAANEILIPSKQTALTQVSGPDPAAATAPANCEGNTE